MTPRLYIGTAGLSVWYSDDLGETLHRFWGTSGMYSETRVWALASHPERPDELLAGTDSGIYRLDIPAAKWTHLPSEMDSLCIWSVARSPHDPDLDPRRDAPARDLPLDRRRENLGARESAAAGNLSGVLRPRVTRILFDPDDPDLVFAGWRSAACGARPTAASRSRTRRRDLCRRTSTTWQSCATARGSVTPPPTWACM